MKCYVCQNKGCKDLGHKKHTRYTQFINGKAELSTAGKKKLGEDCLKKIKMFKNQKICR